MRRKKKVLQESLLCVDWQRYSKRFHEDIRNIRVLFDEFFRCLFPEKGIIGRNHSSTLKLESSSMQSRAEGKISQKRTLGKKESRWDKLAKSKRAKIGVHSFAGSFASKALAE